MVRRDTARSRELLLMVCSVSNVVEHRTYKVGWVAVCSCERKSEVSCPTEYQMNG